MVLGKGGPAWQVRFFGLFVGNGQFCGHEHGSKGAGLRSQGGFHLNGSGGVARHPGSLASVSRRGSRVPTEAAGLAEALTDALCASGERFEPRATCPRGVPPRRTEPRTAGRGRPEWQLMAGAGPVPGAIPT